MAAQQVIYAHLRLHFAGRVVAGLDFLRDTRDFAHGFPARHVLVGLAAPVVIVCSLANAGRSGKVPASVSGVYRARHPRKDPGKSPNCEN